MPAFSVWSTDFDRYVKFSGERRADPYQFFSTRLAQFESLGMPPLRLVCEKYWMEDDRPYYNIHPGIISHLIRINLATIPSELIEIPSNYSAINIRFSQPDSAFTLNTALTSRFQIPAGAWIHGLLMTDFRRVCPRQGVDIQNKVAFIIDFDQMITVGGQQQPAYGVFPLTITPGQDLEEAFQATVQKVRFMCDEYEKLVVNCLKLAVSIGFLANANQDMVTPDVLARFRDEYYDPRTPKMRKEWIEKKSQHGNKTQGWNVGNDVMFLDRASVVGSSSDSEGSGRELTHAHIRTGHFHAVRYGTQHSKVKLMWFRSTTVRPDLPFEKETR